MTSQNTEENAAQSLGKHAAAPKPLTKREQRKAQKAARKAAADAAKQAKRAAKAAQKAAKKGGGVVAPAATATAAQALGQQPAATPEKTTELPVQSPAQPAAPAVSTPQNSNSSLSHLPSTIAADSSGAYTPTQAAAPVQAPEAQEHVHMGEAESFADASQYAAGEPAGFVPATATDGFSQYSRYNVEQAQGEQRQPKPKRNRGKVAAAILIVLACLVGAGFAGANMYLDSLNKNLAGEDEQEAKEVKEALSPVPIGDEPFYMLLVGCDDREGVDGVRADTTILARLDPKKNIVTLVSIPRDTAIEIDGYGTQKFNAAYTYGGPSGTIEAAKQLCGVEISHYAEVHFEALIDIIDYIGGVDVDVPIAIDDVDAGGKVDAGLQHLDGEHAVVFARSRSYANGDFQRTTSQRLLIEAAVEKVLSMDPTEYPGLLSQVTQSMTTDFSIQELLGLAQAFADEPELTMYSTMVPSTTAEMDGVSYVVTDINALAELMAVVDAGGDPSTVEFEDTTVKTSKEAEEQGIEVIVNEGDDVVDGYYDYNYYDPNFYTDYGYYDYSYDESYDDGSGYEDDGSSEEEGAYEDDSGDGGYEEE